MQIVHSSARVTLAVVLSALLCVPAASASTKLERSQTRQIKTLKRHVKTLKGQIASVKRQLSTTKTGLETTIGGLNGQLGALTGQVGALTGTVGARDATIASLAAENAGLRGSLSEGIAAIARRNNVNDLASLVLEPALNNWICGGSKTVASYVVSFSFDGHYDDGSCL
jgi:septal ring factor EnvC (AmiA/AmiB activator)